MFQTYTKEDIEQIKNGARIKGSCGHWIHQKGFSDPFVPVVILDIKCEKCDPRITPEFLATYIDTKSAKLIADDYKHFSQIQFEFVKYATQIERSGKDLALLVKTKLIEFSLPRVSNYPGGEIIGWTDNDKDKGFSLTSVDPDFVNVRIVLSGQKAGINYTNITSDNQIGHEPIDAEKIYPIIKTVFEDIGLEVEKIQQSGYSVFLDDDISYNILVKRPKWLTDDNNFSFNSKNNV